MKPPTRTPPSNPIAKPFPPPPRPLPRPRVLPAGRLTKAERRELEATEAKLRRRGLLVRPKVYPRDCPPPGTPCGYASCPHTLLIDIDPETEAITENFPDTDISTLAETCSLRAADRGGMTVEAVALALNRSTTYVEETVETALRKGGVAVGAKPRGAGGI